MSIGDIYRGEAALVIHDHLAQWGGAEYVVDNICRSVNGSLLLGYAQAENKSRLKYVDDVRTCMSAAVHKYRDLILPLFFFSPEE